jgi:hypothetical protein
VGPANDGDGLQQVRVPLDRAQVGDDAQHGIGGSDAELLAEAGGRGDLEPRRVVAVRNDLDGLRGIVFVRDDVRPHRLGIHDDAVDEPVGLSKSRKRRGCIPEAHVPAGRNRTRAAEPAGWRPDHRGVVEKDMDEAYPSAPQEYGEPRKPDPGARRAEPGNVENVDGHLEKSAGLEEQRGAQDDQHRLEPPAVEPADELEQLALGAGVEAFERINQVGDSDS